MVAPDRVSLPFVTVGHPVPTGLLTVSNTGNTAIDGVSLTITSGAFSVTPLAEIPAGGEVSATVRYLGATNAPWIEVGAAALTVDGQTSSVALAAVVGDADLPAPAWDTDLWGTHATAPFPSAPFPDGDASVLVAVPPAFTDDGDVGVVTHLHGFWAVVDDTLADQYLVELHAMSGRNTVFVAPQGPVNEASGDFGALEDPGGHERLVRDVVSVLYRDGYVTWPQIGAQVLTSHSGGYAAAASVVTGGGLPIAGLHLYDSVYGYVSTFADYALDGGVLFSSYTATGGTVDTNLDMSDQIDAGGVDVIDDFRPDHLALTSAAVGASDAAHMDVATDDLTYARWLAASPVRRSPRAAPELLAVLADGAGGATVRWRSDRVSGAGTVVVEGSDDGASWTELGRAPASATTADVPGRAFVHLVGEDAAGVRGAPGDTYAGGGTAWLVVDGFDRVFGGSWSLPTHDFAAQVGAALGGASSAEDDAVAEGVVHLSDYDHVLWLLGDEGTADHTFDADVRAAIEDYLDGGGALLVSGAELGYATDPAFLDVLGVTYVADDAAATRAGGYTFGVTYPEDYPDVLDADDIVWTYATGGGAAVGRDHAVLAVGFGVETLDPAELPAALAELAAYL